MTVIARADDRRLREIRLRRAADLTAKYHETYVAMSPGEQRALFDDAFNETADIEWAMYQRRGRLATAQRLELFARLELSDRRRKHPHKSR